MGGQGSEACEQCGCPCAEEQHYCLGCGARIGQRSPQLEQLLRRAGGRARPQDGAAQGSAAPALAASPPAPAPAPLIGLRLPSPRVSALLVLVFLGFGVILGGEAGSRVDTTLASTRSPLKVVLPASGSPPAPVASAEAPAASSEAEAPSSQPEPTPAPASSTGSAPHAAAPKQTSGSGGSSGGGSGGGSSGAGGGGASSKLPPVKHVFVIMLSDEPYAGVFGPSSTAPYLSGTLERQGELLVRYDAVAHEELSNEVALLSGQGATLETAANCPTYTEIAPTGTGSHEQVLGNGCVYPSSTRTLAGQLTAKRLTWRAYVQGIDEGGGQPGACAHPGIGQADPTADQSSSAGAYATFRNPFVYFRSLTASPACAADDVGLDRLEADLASVKSTASFSYIVPDRCDDANPTPCTPGAPAGPAQADAFLKVVVPEITGSKAYKESGLLVITVDEAPSSGEFADSSSCCGQPLFPNAPSTTPAGAPRGGGAVGALLLSPFVKGGTTTQESFNHFSLLRTIEDLFGLGHLGYAGLSAVKSFEPSMFTSAKG